MAMRKSSDGRVTSLDQSRATIPRDTNRGVPTPHVHPGAEALLALQRSAGNSATLHLITSRGDNDPLGTAGLLDRASVLQRQVTAINFDTPDVVKGSVASLGPA